jgi:hypothetical protein
MRTLFAAILISTLAACGGSAPAPAAPVAHEGGGEHEGGEHHEHHLTPELDAFHELLAPAWHTEPEDKRDEAGCASVERLVEAAASVETAGVPAGADSKAWTDGAAALKAAVGAMQQDCASNGPHITTFPAVHDAFHHLMELVPSA